MLVTTATDKRIMNIMQLLGDATRYKMFKLLALKSDLCVSEIAAQLNVSPSAVSQHFRQFELLGIVEKQRHGQKICYELAADDSFVLQLTKLLN